MRAWEARETASGIDYPVAVPQVVNRIKEKLAARKGQHGEHPSSVNLEGPQINWPASPSLSDYGELNQASLFTETMALPGEQPAQLH
jgi:hypothetical protein